MITNSCYSPAIQKLSNAKRHFDFHHRRRTIHREYVVCRTCPRKTGEVRQKIARYFSLSFSNFDRLKCNATSQKQQQRKLQVKNFHSKKTKKKWKLSYSITYCKQNSPCNQCGIPKANDFILRSRICLFVQWQQAGWFFCKNMTKKKWNKNSRWELGVCKKSAILIWLRWIFRLIVIDFRHDFSVSEFFASFCKRRKKNVAWIEQKVQIPVESILYRCDLIED